jgi:phosphotransferase system enzyme I (PtsI)
MSHGAEQQVQGHAVSRGIAMGRAVVVGSARLGISQQFIDAEQMPAELDRLRQARRVVEADMARAKQQLMDDNAQETAAELIAMVDVHLMLLHDQTLTDAVRAWVVERHYNAEWALQAQLEIVARQFDEMQDPYLRERKVDLEQVVERLLLALRGDGVASMVPDAARSVQRSGEPMVLVAHDLSPAELLQFRSSMFGGFVTDVGGKTSHTAIVARSLDIPAVVGARGASEVIANDDWVVIDGDAGCVVINPSDDVVQSYIARQQKDQRARERLQRLRHTPARTRDGVAIALLANIESPADTQAALAAGAVGVGLFRSEFLYMGRTEQGLTLLPSEDEQYEAYTRAVLGMGGLPTTIRTVDVGADKPLGQTREAFENPALGLRAVRWSLADTDMFRTQLRALLRAAAHGPVEVLVPMLSQRAEIEATFEQLARASHELDSAGVTYAPVRLGAMIEVPAAALSAPMFLRYFDFLSIGTNDLIQYTLAVDRTDDRVAHLYDPLHPVVLQLIGQVIAQGQAAGKPVAVCGEMAGDVEHTALLLGLGLRQFSIHPSHLLEVKERLLAADVGALTRWVQQALASDNPAEVLARAP